MITTKALGLNIKQEKPIVLAAYVIEVTVNTKDHFQKTKNLINTVKNIDLIINENKTKFIIALRKAFIKCNNI